MFVFQLTSTPLTGQTIIDREEIVQLLADSLSGRLTSEFDGSLPCVRVIDYPADSSVRAIMKSADSLLGLRSTQLPLDPNDTNHIRRLWMYSALGRPTLDTMQQEIIGRLGSALRKTTRPIDTTNVREIQIIASAADSMSAEVDLSYSGYQRRKLGRAFWDGLSYGFRRQDNHWHITNRRLSYSIDGRARLSPRESVWSPECLH